MAIVFTILAIICLAAFVYVNVLHNDDYMGTIVPVIVSTVVGLVWTIGAVAVLCTGNLKSGLTALVVGIGMFGRAYVEYRTYMDVQDFYARWGRRG